MQLLLSTVSLFKSNKLYMAILLLLMMRGISQASVTSDIDVVKERIRQEILSQEPASEAAIKAWLSKQKADGSWPDINYEDQSRTAWAPTQHLQRMRQMAIAYYHQGHAYAQSPAVRKSFMAALDFYADKKPNSDNWWYNRIGQQQTLGEALMAMHEELTPGQIQAGSSILQPVSVPCGGGQNLVWVATNAIYKGCLEHSAAYMEAGFEAIQSTVVVTQEEGIQVDWSFHQHGPQLYSGGYGLNFVRDVSYWMSMGRGTTFAFDDEKVKILEHLMLDGHQWMVRHEVMDYSVTGREITRMGISHKASQLIEVCHRMAALGTSRKNEFEALAAFIQGQRGPVLEGNKYFWRSDYLAHQQQDYFTSLKMYATGLRGTEKMNEENLKGFYLPQGTTFIYQRGDEYADIFPVWDWTRLPGTTCRQEKTPPPIDNTYMVGDDAFVGAVSDGSFGFAAYDYSDHEVKAKRCWLYFDEGFFCLGGAIQSTSSNPIITSVNQCLLKGDVQYEADNEEMTTASLGKSISDKVQWVHHDRIGYVFPVPTEVVLKNEPQTGSWKSINNTYSADTVEKNVFSLWIPHGTSPSEAAYQYLVLPGKSAGETAAYASHIPLKVVANTTGLQAVTHTGLGVTGIAFYQPQKVTLPDGLSISVDKPCLLLVKEQDEQVVAISVADPLKTAAEVHVWVSARLPDEQATWDSNHGTTTLVYKLPEGAYSGQTVTRQFSQ